MREPTNIEMMQRAIGGLKAFEAFITNLGEDQISDTACEEFGAIIGALETVEMKQREEDSKVILRIPDGMLGAVKHDEAEQ